MNAHTEDAKRWLRNQAVGIKDDTLDPTEIIREVVEYAETLEEEITFLKRKIERAEAEDEDED